MSTRTVVLYLSRLLAGIAGAWLYSKHPFGPFVLEPTMLILAFLAALFLKEQRVDKATAQNNRQHINEAVAYVWEHSFLRNYFLTIFITAVATESVWYALQPYFSFRAVAPAYFGLLYAIIALLSAAGAFLTRRIPERVNGITVSLYMCLGAIIGTLVMQLTNKWFVIPAIIPLGFAFGFSAPVIYSEIQKHTSSKYQSTVLSAQSLLYTGTTSTVGILVGRYVDLYGSATMLKILFAQAIICATLIGGIVLVTKSQRNGKLAT